MNPFTNTRPPDYYNPPPPQSNYPPNYNYHYNYPPGHPGPPGYPGHSGPPGPLGYPGHAPPPPNYYNHNHNHPPAPQNHMHGPPPSHFPPNTGLYKPPQPPTTLTISRSPHDSSLLHLTPASSPGGHGDSIPQYTAQISKNNKPHIKLYRGAYLLPNPLGTASMHTWSSTTDCYLASSDPSNFRVKEGSLSGYFTIDHPRPLGPGSGAEKGTCKWKESLTSSTLDLQDGKGGNKVAKIRISTGLSGKGKMVETYVPLSEEAMDMVVLSGLVAMVVSKDMLEDGLDILGDVLDD